MAAIQNQANALVIRILLRSLVLLAPLLVLLVIFEDWPDFPWNGSPDASYTEFSNFCVSAAGLDLDEGASHQQVGTLAQCKKLCTSQVTCNAVEWYEFPWHDAQCYLVSGVAAKGARGTRIKGASCHVKNRLELFVQEVTDAREQIDALENKNGHQAEEPHLDLGKFMARLREFGNRTAREHRRLRGNSEQQKLDQLNKQISELQARLKKLRNERDKVAENVGRKKQSNRREVIVEHKPWVWHTWLIAITLLLVVCVGLTGCCAVFWSFLVEEMSSQMDYLLVLPESELDEQAMLMIIKREMRLMLLYPFIPLAAVSATTCSSGMPAWAYYIYIPLLLRAKLIEFKILRQLGKTYSDIFFALGFWLGIVDHADWFTDGALPIQAAMCGNEVTHGFAASFEQSAAWPLVPIIRVVTFPGILVIVLLVAAMAQQAGGSLASSADNFPSAVAADIPGFGALADYFEKECIGVADKATRKTFNLVVRVFLETLLQLWLQSSLFALIFSILDSAGRIKLLLSIGLGLMCAAYKLVQGMLAVKYEISENPTQPMGFYFFFVLPPVLALLLGLCTLAWTCAKLYFSFSCPSHLWNLTSGCVHSKGSL